MGIKKYIRFIGDSTNFVTKIIANHFNRRTVSIFFLKKVFPATLK